MFSDKNAILTVIARCLGALWIFDGLLQFQPQMFGQGFVVGILVPNLSDQPTLLRQIVQAGIYFWNLDPVVSDILAACLQIGIGMLLLFPLGDKRFKIGASVSIAWGIVVWLCGEGAGLLLTGNASLYTGAPGAVMLYVVLAIVLLLHERMRLQWFTTIAVLVFLLGAALQLQPIFWTQGGVQAAAMASMMESVTALQAFPASIANLLGIDPVASNAILALLPLIVGVLLFIKPNRITGSIALVFLGCMWWVGQDLGMLTSGIGTDPSTAPLVALFLLPLFLKRDAPTNAHA